ncbi:MAG TPA: hypothetical protein VI583_03830 [Cyclobacteriaceae bacterium]|nr:hypothetical protein [Cyclobacteriaceae bacterium]
MIPLIELQQKFFNEINLKIPPNHSLVHEVSEILGISDDSVYRRIRGEKEMTFHEIFKLCSHFSISFDNLMNLESRKVIFESVALDPVNLRLSNWFGIILEEMKNISASREAEVIYSAIDLPVFHLMQIPELMAFKIFFWEKTLFQFPDYGEKKLQISDIDENTKKICRQINDQWVKIPTTEIWNADTFNIFLRQLEFYWLAGYLESRDDVLSLCDHLIALIEHIRKQAELGMKFLIDNPSNGIVNSFILYENEVSLNDNTILIKRAHASKVFLTYNVLSLLSTQNAAFCAYTENYLKKLMSKSNLMSVTGDKTRNRFFNKALNTITAFRNRVI